MEKIKFITDSPSDIPDEDLKRLDISLCNVPVAIDGMEFIERESLSFDEFYKALNNAKEIPVTSRVPIGSFLDEFQKAYVLGYNHVVCCTINSKASGTNESAHGAKNAFFADHPDAHSNFSITIIDSRSYSLAYGYPVIKAAEMAKETGNVIEIIAFLEDWFNRIEIYAGCYTLKYAGKSGRINFATAFVGEALGMRPIISLIEGKTNTVLKVRGDKKIQDSLIDIYKNAGINPEDPVVILMGENVEDGKTLQERFKKELKINAPTYKVGASIAINIGPKVLGLVYLGKSRAV